MTDFSARVAAIASDNTSGASELMRRVADLITEGLAAGAGLRPLATELLRAQPSMAPIWNLIGHAVAARGEPVAFGRYRALLERAPRTLTRHAEALFTVGPTSATLRLVTLSFSGTVLTTLLGVAKRRGVEVACAEGRPALEGRRMAEELSRSGIPVMFYTDAGLGQALDGSDAVIVGADAISPLSFLNKSGTRMLVAAATQQGVPVYVCATRDKFVTSAIAARLVVRDESPEELWPSPPAGVTIRNRYFEATSLDFVTAVISDLGVLGAAMVPAACESPNERLLLDLAGPT